MFGIGRNCELVVAVSTVALLLAAIQCRAETLSDALRQTYAGNPKLNAERARQRSEYEKIPQAGAAFLPTIVGSADYGASREGTYAKTTTFTNVNPRGVGVTLSQTIFNGLRNVNDYQRANFEVLAGNSSVNSTEQQTLLAGVQAYMRVVRDRSVLSLRANNLSTLREQMGLAQARFGHGDITRTALDQTRTRLAEAEGDLAQARADLADSEATYTAVIGQNPHSPSSPPLGRVVLPNNVAESLAIAVRENPQIQSALHLQTAADKAADVARGAYWPTLSLEGSLRRGIEDDKVLHSSSSDATVRLKLSAPIYSGGYDTSKIRQADETRAQRQLEVDDAIVNVRKAVSAAFEAHRQSKIRRAAAARRIAAADAAQYGLQTEFKSGQIPLFMVLDGRREVVNARIAATTAQHDEVVTTFLLLSALGRMNIDVASNLSAGRGVNAVAPSQSSSARALSTERTRALSTERTRARTVAVGEPGDGVAPSPVQLAPSRAKLRATAATTARGDVAPSVGRSSPLAAIEPPANAPVAPPMAGYRPGFLEALGGLMKRPAEPSVGQVVNRDVNLGLTEGAMGEETLSVGSLHAPDLAAGPGR